MVRYVIKFCTGLRCASIVLISLVCNTFVTSVFAVESGNGAYLLGSRDLGAGFVPAPGFYQSNDFVYMTGEVASLSIGGVILTNAELDLLLYKSTFTYVPDVDLLGARMGISVIVPYASADIAFNGVLGGLLAGELTDSQKGFGDLTVVPVIGWDSGNFHFNLAGTMFLPTGEYSTATIDVPNRSIDALSIGKNRFAFDPTFSMTYLDKQTGFEASGSLGVTFSKFNEATDYQTAPELHFEGTIAQHLSNGLVFGVTGYAYQQLDDDSGAGAESFKAATGAKSLQARVFGAGPILSWATKVGDVGVSTKIKYIHEFGARRRFESQGVFGNVTFAF